MKNIKFEFIYYKTLNLIEDYRNIDNCCSKAKL